MEMEEKNIDSVEDRKEDLAEGNESLESQEDINYDAVSEFYQILSENFNDAIEKSPMGDFLFNSIKGGSRTVYSKTIRETKVFEKSFITILETAFRSISKILKDPKKAIRYEQEVVPMEKAKKVNSETVRHLASHTQFIKEVKENGDIIPSKLLTTFAEDEVGIYENRFIKTLINRICKFLSLRVQIMKKNLDSYETKSTAVTNSFNVDKTKIKVELSVKMERTLEAQVKAARDTYKRAVKLHDDFKTLRSSKLMQDLKNYKEVTPPILKTNIILKNPEFKVCYNTWVFLDRYNELAFDVNVKERKNKYPDQLAESIDSIMSEAVGTLLYYNGDSSIDPENMPYKEFTTRKARMLSKMDDEYKFNPSSQKLEKFEMSEYFLNKTQEFYQQSLEDKMSSGMEKKYSLELVFREMLEVLNSIYPPLFDLPYQTEDFEDIPLSVKLERAQKKAEVLETIVRLKEIDFNATKKEYDDTLQEIQSTEDKMRQQAAREARLEKLAKEKAERAAKREAEREALRKEREEEALRRKAEREAEREHKEQLKAEEKARLAEAKAKLLERREQIKAEQEKIKAERAAAREAKRKAREEAEAARAAERERIAEEERKLEAEKAHIDAKELLRRRREIIRQKAAAQRAEEEALRQAALEEENDEDDDIYKDIDTALSELEAKVSANEAMDNTEDGENPSDHEDTLDPKELLRARREAIRRKALETKNEPTIEDSDEENKTSREEFLDRRKNFESEADALLNEENVVKDDEVAPSEKPEEAKEMDARSLFERNRDIIRRRAMMSQKEDDVVKDESETKNSDEEIVDPKELLRRRREEIKKRALASKALEEETKKPEEVVDPKELLRRRREAIRQRALEANKNNEEDN